MTPPRKQPFCRPDPIVRFAGSRTARVSGTSAEDGQACKAQQRGNTPEPGAETHGPVEQVANPVWSKAAAEIADRVNQRNSFRGIGLRQAGAGERPKWPCH